MKDREERRGIPSRKNGILISTHQEAAFDRGRHDFICLKKIT